MRKMEQREEVVLRQEVARLSAELKELKELKESQRSADNTDDTSQRSIRFELLLAICVCNLVFWRWANKFTDELFGIVRTNHHDAARATNIDWAPCVMLLPLLVLG